MKITSGKLKSKEIMVPKSGVKPTSDKVKQAVMNILQPRIRGSRFLDLYAGTGAAGLEALSNGASYACFVENAPRVYMIMKKNIESMVEDKSAYRTIKHNALQLTGDLLEMNSFDIVFADPFYRESEDHYDELYRAAMGFVKEGGVFILEHSSKKSFSDFPFFHNQKIYGDTSLTVFVRPNGGPGGAL